MVYFQTKRLLVRSYTLKDVEGLSQVMGDQRVHLYTKDRNHPWIGSGQQSMSSS